MVAASSNRRGSSPPCLLRGQGAIRSNRDMAGVRIDNRPANHQAVLQPIFSELGSVQIRYSLHAIFCFLLLACGSVVAQQAATSSPTKAPVEAVLTDRDNGTDVDLAPNTPLIVKLPSNPSTGYAWAIVGDPSPLKLQKAFFRKGKTKSGAMGVSGTEVFRLTASSAGMATLTLVYRRSWEYNLPPMKTFSVRVNVR